MNNFEHCKPITVGELIEALKEYPKDMRVAMSSDSEGNRYSYIPDNQFIADDVYMPLNDWDDDPIHCDKKRKNRCKCIVLFPA